MFRSRYFLVVAGAGVKSGSSSTVHKIDEIFNDTGILFVSSHIDKRLFKNKYLQLSEIFLVIKMGMCLIKWLKANFL